MNKNPLYFAAILCGVAIIFYFSWLPDPNIGLNSYFPKWLGKWTNENGNLRTAVPFFFLGGFLELCLVKSYKVIQTRLIIITCLVFVVVLAEGGQLILPKRHFDLEDIIYGLLGSVVGITIIIFLKNFMATKNTD